MKLLQRLIVQEDLSTGNGERTVFDVETMFSNGVADCATLGVKSTALGTGTTKNMRVDGILDAAGYAVGALLLVNTIGTGKAVSVALPAAGASDLLIPYLHTHYAWFPFGFHSMKWYLDEDYDTGTIDFILSLYDSAQV